MMGTPRDPGSYTGSAANVGYSGASHTGGGMMGGAQAGAGNVQLPATSGAQAGYVSNVGGYSLQRTLSGAGASVGASGLGSLQPASSVQYQASLNSAPSGLSSNVHLMHQHAPAPPAFGQQKIQSPFYTGSQQHSPQVLSSGGGGGNVGRHQPGDDIMPSSAAHAHSSYSQYLHKASHGHAHRSVAAHHASPQLHHGNQTPPAHLNSHAHTYAHTPHQAQFQSPRIHAQFPPPQQPQQQQQQQHGTPHGVWQWGESRMLAHANSCMHTHPQILVRDFATNTAAQIFRRPKEPPPCILSVKK